MSIEATVEVVWKEEHPRNGKDYRVAVKFVNISEKDREGLKEYVHTFYGLKRSPI